LLSINSTSPPLSKNQLRASNVYINLVPGKKEQDFQGLLKMNQRLPKTSEVDQRFPKSYKDLSEEGF